MPESATRQVGLSNGQYALLPNIDAATALQLKGKPNVKLSETMDLAYTLIGMNVSKPPFDNPKVREAVNYAINRQRFVDTALAGVGEAQAIPWPKSSPAYDAELAASYTFDLARAKQLVAESGVATRPIAP